MFASKVPRVEGKSTDAALAGARVLVTGGCGFIGTNLVAALLARGAQVVALDLPGAHWERLPAAAQSYAADLLDSSSLEAGLEGFDIVYHLAARTDLEGKDPTDYAANTEGTAHLIRALGHAGFQGRFVHYSTQLVVGLFGETRFIDASEPYRTATAYGQSKIESELIVERECSRRGIEFTIIRPTSVYGPFGGAPYREFFQTIKRGRYVHVGRADNLVSLAYVNNLVDLTLVLSVHPDAAENTYFGTDFHPYTMREIVDEVAAHYGVRISQAPVWLVTLVAYILGAFKTLGLNVPLYPFRLRNMRMSYCYDVQPSVRLGYDPRYGLSEGIRETLAWYDAHDPL